MTPDRNVLAAMLLAGSERDLARVIESEVVESDFADPTLGRVFSRLVDIWRREGVITAVDAVAACEGLDLVPWSLADNDVSTVRLSSYLADLKAAGARRKLKAVLSESLNRLTDNADPQSVMQHIAEESTRIGSTNASRVESIEVVSDRLYDQYAAAMSSGFEGVRSPFPHLDAILGGYPPGMHILAARPKVGKSSFAGCEALLLAMQGVPIYFASLEMSSERIIDRMVAQLMGRGTAAIWHGVANAELLDQANAIRDKIRGLPIHFAANCAVNLDELILDIRASMIRHGVRFAVVDHIGKIAPGKAYRSQYDKITEYSNRISAEAKNMRLPIRTVCHVGRSGEGKEGAAIGMSDLRESGHLEQDAESITFLNHEGAFIAAHVAANRNGRSDWTRFLSNLETHTWIDDGKG